LSSVVLTKDDGLVCSLPAASVVAILSTALDTPLEKRPHMRSVLVSNFRGDTRSGLGHTAAEAADEVEKAWPGEFPPPWIELSSGADVTRIMAGLIRGFDQLSEALMRVDFERPDGEIASGLIDNTPENLARVSADLKGC
jgi:hypothetical protein